MKISNMIVYDISSLKHVFQYVCHYIFLLYDENSTHLAPPVSPSLQWFVPNGAYGSIPTWGYWTIPTGFESYVTTKLSRHNSYSSFNKFLVCLHGEYNILVKLCGNTT